MKGFIAATLALLTLAVAGVGQAANPRSCQTDWQAAQTATGLGFANIGGCASYVGRGGVLYTPTASVTPTTVHVFENVVLTGAGFHPNAGLTMSVALVGQADPYFSQEVAPTNDYGFASITTFHFTACPNGTLYVLVVSLTDSYGVHASAPLLTLLC